MLPGWTLSRKGRELRETFARQSEEQLCERSNEATRQCAVRRRVSGALFCYTFSVKIKMLLAGVLLLVVFSLLEAEMWQNWVVTPRVAPILRTENGEILSLILADTERDRIRGLGRKAFIREDEGMLFIFPASDFHGIWMKEMRFPLDIIWLEKRIVANTRKRTDTDTELVVVDMKEGATSETYPLVFYPRQPAGYVLEVNEGSAKKAGISIGSVLTFSR